MIRALSPYFAVFGSKCREELQYRAAAVAGIVTQAMFGFLIAMVLLAFYESSDRPSPMTVSQTLAYVWLGQAFFGLLPWNVEPAIYDSIRNGSVVQELLRPVDTYRWWFARAMAWRVVRTGLRCLPMVVLTLVLFPWIGLAHYALPGPASLSSFFLFCPALGVAILLSVTLTLLIQVAMLWVVTPEGVLRLMPALVVFFSGNLIPLPLLPDWLQPLLAAQPFRGLTDTPLRIYGGHLTGKGAWSALGTGLVWVLVLNGFGFWAFHRGMRRLVIAGG